MAAFRYLEFLKRELLAMNRLTVHTVNMHHCAKFRGDWSKRSRDMAICHFLQNGGRPPSSINLTPH